jgi:hypothetical protein
MTTRVLYAPRNISGQATEYAAAIRPFGYSGEVWSFGPPAYGFPVDRVIDPERMLTDTGYRWDVLDDAVRRFDVFHLQYSRSLLHPVGHVLPELWDLPLLRSLGKRVYMHFRGSDVRLPSRHVAREPDSYLRDTPVEVDEDRILGRIAVCRRFCDAMLVSTPGLLDEVPDAIWTPHVVDVASWATPPRTEPDVPTVVHIPSSRATKGSDVIDPALRALDAQGVIVYRSLSGLGRGELREAIRGADMLVDSITIGDHGLISVEAMAAGTIPIAHVHEENRRRNPGSPVVEATVHDLATVVESLARDPARRAGLRDECRRFARRRHDRPVVGALLAQVYGRPSRPVERSHPDWPRSETRTRVLELEREIDRLRADVDPSVRGAFGLRSLPEAATERLLSRVGELESALETERPDHPLLVGRGRWRPVDGPRSWRDLVKRNPTVHRAARWLALTLRRVVRR